MNILALLVWTNLVTGLCEWSGDLQTAINSGANYSTSAVIPDTFVRVPEAAGALLDRLAPILDQHTLPSEIPTGGLFYRLRVSGPPDIYELWYARDTDHVSAQLSAHDATGKSIIKTRNLDTGVESTIDIEEISIDVSKRNELRQDGRAIKTNLAALVDLVNTNLDLIKANNVSTNANAAAVRTGLIKNTTADEETNKLLKQALQGNRDLTILVLQLMKGPK